MALVYNENEVYTGPIIPFHKINANRSYLRHFENSLLLSFMLSNGNTTEKMQASKELAIAQRKMERMEKHPNFDLQAILPEMTKLRRQWSTKR